MNAPATFKTLAAAGTGLYKEKGSKFLAFALPVHDRQEIDRELSRLKKKYHDARHHCYAWVLQTDGSEYRAYDDGEPAHSAGDSILGQIRSRSLTYTLVVVVRYFGGTKLGLSGLVHAYKTAARLALEQSPVAEHQVTRSFILHYPYSATPAAMRLIREFGIRVLKQEYGSACTLSGAVPVGRAGVLQQKTEQLQHTGHPITLTWQENDSPKS